MADDDFSVMNFCAGCHRRYGEAVDIKRATVLGDRRLETLRDRRLSAMLHR
jgi:hypothetical protein